jgi:N-methylhydantoinase A/oxoprolinase/acetone carboxylase beta subunit
MAPHTTSRLASFRTAIYDRARLPVGAHVAGPAIVEQADTTTVVPPGYAAVVDASRNIRITRVHASAAQGAPAHD